MPHQTTFVSFSELDTFRQCPLKHELAYKERWQPPEISPALSRGTLWHEVMQAHYTALQAALGIREALKSGHSVLKASNHPDVELVSWMYEGYTDQYSWDPNWTVFAVEQKVNVRLPTPTGGPSRFVLKGVLDLVIRERDTGDLWIVDHKTCKDLPKNTELDLDDQFGIYTWMLRKGGLGHWQNVRGVIHSAARTARLKREMTLEERFRRTKTFRTDRELNTLVVEVYRTFQTAYSYKIGEAPRAPNTDTCRWRCPFTEPCLMHRKTPDRDRAQLLHDWSFRQNWDRH